MFIREAISLQTALIFHERNNMKRVILNSVLLSLFIVNCMGSAGIDTKSVNAGQNTTADMTQYWIENRGQIEDGAVKYYISRPGSMLYLCEDFVVRMDFRTYEDPPDSGLMFQDMAVLKQYKAGTSTKDWLPKGQKTGVVNFLIGEKAKHKTGCKTFNSIEANKYWGNKTLIEFQIDGDKVRVLHTVEKGGNVALVQVENEGQNSMAIDTDGNLHLVFDEGLADIILSKPLALQTIGGIPVNVSASFRLVNSTTFGFNVGTYDTRYDLVIWYR